jgi:hypothetical protein
MTRVTIRNLDHAYQAAAGEAELKVSSGDEGGVVIPPGEEREFDIPDEGLKIRSVLTEKGEEVKKKREEDEKAVEKERSEPKKGAAESKKAPTSPGLADPYPQPSGASRK